MNVTDTVMIEMIKYYQNDPKRIQHFTKVHAYASLIGRMEGLEKEVQRILELAALVHDIGIKPAEEKYHDCNGKLQEQEGPAPAEELLKKADVDIQDIDRIKYLIAHHHTYSNIDGMDYQILVEADFLVNLYEDGLNKENIYAVRESVFRTNSGIQILNEMFGLEI